MWHLRSRYRPNRYTRNDKKDNDALIYPIGEYSSFTVVVHSFYVKVINISLEPQILYTNFIKFIYFNVLRILIYLAHAIFLLSKPLILSGNLIQCSLRSLSSGTCSEFWDCVTLNSLPCKSFSTLIPQLSA